MPTATSTALSKPSDCERVPTADELDEVDKRHYESDASFAVELSQGLFSAGASGRRVVVVEDYYRAARCTNADGVELVYGVAARLRIGVSDFTGDLSSPYPSLRPPPRSARPGLATT
jgi:hypothetical protein